MVRRTRTDTVATRTPPEVLERFFRDVGRGASKLLSIFENPALWHGADAMMKRP
jgi:hypothetical protein